MHLFDTEAGGLILHFEKTYKPYSLRLGMLRYKH
jgi:hypothetical protein